MSDAPRVEIYTKENCPYCEKAKNLFDAKEVEYETYNVTGDEDLFEEMVDRAEGRKTAPEVFVNDELIGGWDETSALDETGELDEMLGIARDDDCEVVEHRRLLIAGTGIAGLTAAIYAGRSNNEPLVIEGDEPGGQLTLTTDVANYPGFPEGISGPELVNNMKEQARQFGAELKNGIVENVERLEDPSVVEDVEDATEDSFCVDLTNGDRYTADAVIVASGASARTLGIPGEDELMGYGLSTCATCDGAFFRDEDMLVVGGGDAAMEEASFLTKFADTVYLAHRREEFRAEDYWIDRVHEHVQDGNIEIMKNTELVEIHGSQEEGVDHVTLVRNEKGHPTDRLDDPETEEFDFDVGAVFFAIGHTPNTDYLEGLGIETDEEGYLETNGGDGGGQTETAVPGIFGAGDVVDYHYQQAVTAAGMGSKAAIDADEYLEDLEREREEAVLGESEEVPAADD
ncbi:FAD-dependent oxidoreductase [Natronosalvus halobius]|uniref:FAD-dependent oxidoreductase n=1 Tax=Natronosalvus halobius TaxID=2953746 RepID=UPI0020A015F5|nr:FAD-dependent oxidoreductase [Natronosalvus halobius]USZ71635.1 FAD-dependent oxidoreductase [Natronosalvus halobius]